MDPRAKEKHEEEHEDSKKERKSQKNQLLYRESQRLPAWFEPTKKQSSRRNGSYDKEHCIENMKKTYEWKHYKIHRFFHKEGEDYDNSLFQIYLL